MNVLWMLKFLALNILQLVCVSENFSSTSARSREQLDQGWTGVRSVGNNLTSCGDGRCRCNATHADCSNHQGNLTYIPTFPHTIYYLNFSRNNLSDIKNDDFFKNVTHIRQLDLVYNGLKYISSGAFRNFSRLTDLYLSFNRLSYYIITRS
ncbi:hypothetical protein BaRGS_00015087 [Batillaria attramentaria]|uniref:LRRNT domain-containing protein n=1 Tax=Batillaria attramentaria TaxID=370345 RepID=A0ABD0L2L9_9CAEN